MAFESEELRKRQQRRKLEKQRRMERQRRMRQRLTVCLLVAAVILVLCGIMILSLQNDSPTTPTDPIAGETTQPTATEPTEPETVISIAFGGDLNITDNVVAAGATENGYDYTNLLMDVMPLLAGADATVLNLEGNLCGEPYGSKNASAPQELMEALSAAGVDLIQMANSYTVNNGLLGLSSTLDGIRQAGMEPVGAFASKEEFESTKGYTLRSINGLKVAFVAFTKGVGNLGLPEGSENSVNLLYTDYTSTYQDIDTEGIKRILRAVENEQPDLTVALLHWGSEYNNQISDSQIEIAELMLNQGVDAVIGNHSHYAQSLNYNPDAGTVVAYSLGDFLGDCVKSGTEYSLILELEITKNNTTGECKITGVDYSPIYTLRQGNEQSVTTRLLRMKEAIAAFEADSIDKISSDTYNAMKTAMSRLESRLAPLTKKES